MRKSKSIEFGALRIFAAVAESETLTHAAQRLGISQSAVSQTLKQLEELTEVELVVKRSRPIKLTQSGEVLREHATTILADTGRMMNNIKLASRGGLSNLNVGMIDSFGDALGLQFINQIKPMVKKVALRTGLTKSLRQALLNRDIDILVAAEHLDPNPNLKQLTLIRDPFLVIAPASTNTENIKEIASALPFIHYNPESQIGLQTDVIARRIGVELNTHYELDSTQTLMRFVAANLGWAIISALCLVRYPDLLKDSKVINLNDGANARYISQVSRKDELGQLPEQFAEISRTLFTEEVTPQLNCIAPWLANQAYATDNQPI